MERNKNRFYVLNGKLVHLGDMEAPTVLIGQEEDLYAIADQCQPGTMAHLPGYTKVWELDASRVWVEQKEKPNALTYNGSLADLEALEDLANPSIGDMYNVESTGHNYVWNGEEWDDVGGYAILGDDVKAMINAKADKANPVFTGSLQLGETVLSAEGLANLVAIGSANGVEF